LKWTWSLFYALIAVAMVVLLLTIHGWMFLGTRHLYLPNYLSAHEPDCFTVHGLILITMAMLPAVAGALTAYSLKMAFSEQRKQYERMENLYRRAYDYFNEAITKRNEALAQRIVAELGKEALSENGDWVLLHRERKVEMLVGG
jgi:hypothetical protein